MKSITEGRSTKLNKSLTTVFITP